MATGADRPRLGGMLLVAAAVSALVWANSPWGGAYQLLWQTDVSVKVGRYVLEGDLRERVNDALMAVFFLVVGLELKRELVEGDLRDPRTAAMPVFAALGGMAVPVLLYLMVTSGSGGSRGWGIPMGTDIAFALGVVAVVGRRVPASLKLFLLTLATVDDIGAVVVIGFFYSAGLRPQFLLGAVVVVIAILLRNRTGVGGMLGHAALGGALWLVTYASGVHATLAGVVLGLLTPTRCLHPASASPVERIGHLLRPWASLFVVPVFALANAGVVIRADSFRARGASAVTIGVIIGLVVGKTAGITGAAWLATRTGLAPLPEGTTWAMMAAVATVAGIGFTVALFIAELAFGAGLRQDAAKLGVLAGSSLAAVIGGTMLHLACRGRSRPGSPSLSDRRSTGGRARSRRVAADHPPAG